MSTVSDIEKAFAFLHDNIPSWATDIAGIEENLARLRAEMAKLPSSRSAPVKKRTGSIESIRDLDAAAEANKSSADPQTHVYPTRKRKPTSVLSGHASGVANYRTKAMIIVIYDGEIQKSFEKLVRAIGTGRNMLRKGKMAAKMEELSALAGPDSESEDDDDANGAVMAKIGYRHRPALTSMRSRGMMRGTFGNNTNSITSSELFDSTDKALELAQGLCEHAAHQSLRDGDCRKELEGVRKHIQEVLTTATAEHTKYVSRKEKEESDAKASPPAPTPAPTSLEVEPDVETQPSHPKMLPNPAIIPNLSKAIDIEVDVDDDDDDDMDFVMPPIRLTSRA